MRRPDMGRPDMRRPDMAPRQPEPSAPEQQFEPGGLSERGGAHELEAPLAQQTEVDATNENAPVTDEDRAAAGYERDVEDAEAVERRLFGEGIEIATEGRDIVYDDGDRTVLGGPIDPTYTTDPGVYRTLEDDLAALEQERTGGDELVAGVTGQAPPEQGVGYGGYQGGYAEEEDIDEIEEIDEFEIIAEADEADEDLMTTRAEPLRVERESVSDFAQRLDLGDDSEQFQPSEFDPQISSAGRALASFDDEDAYRTPSSGFEQPVTPLPGSGARVRRQRRDRDPDRAAEAGAQPTGARDAVPQARSRRGGRGRGRGRGRAGSGRCGARARARRARCRHR
jgi:hypothetical protein